MQTTRRPFCNTCYNADKGKSVYLLHNQTDTRCPIRVQLSAINEDHVLPKVLESDLIYLNTAKQVGHEPHTVKNSIIAGLQSIYPVAVQILSVMDANNQPLHIELDSASTVSNTPRRIMGHTQ